jgi:hypothetical protein
MTLAYSGLIAGSFVSGHAWGSHSSTVPGGAPFSVPSVSPW